MEPSVQNIVVLLCLFSFHVTAYPNGLVQNACQTMEPQHGTTAQTSTAPYTLTLSKNNYTGGERISVTLSKSSGAPDFKGFLIQARASGSNTPLGSFEISGSNLQTLTCTTPGSAVSHTSANLKSSVQMTWVAPNSSNSDIQLIMTVVQSGPVYWTRVQSPKLSYQGSNGCQILVSAFSHFLLLVVCAMLAL
ncbi:putative ferric-chelate reductase 1 [Discoglossus pictus]